MSIYVRHPSRKTNKIVVTPLSNKSIVVIPSTKFPRCVYYNVYHILYTIYSTYIYCMVYIAALYNMPSSSYDWFALFSLPLSLTHTHTHTHVYIIYHRKQTKLLLILSPILCVNPISQNFHVCINTCYSTYI